jgi:nitrite reductase/ring-hydroxylating ferredoxin subunit
VTSTAQWQRACAAGELADDEARLLPVSPPVAVFRAGGEYFATDDTCTHAESSLSEGYVEDGKVECVFHFALFCVRTGAALTAPAVKPLRTYPVKVEDGVVYVDLSSRDEL